MSKVLALSESATPPPDPRAEEFDREPEYSLLRVNTDQLVHKSDLKKTIDEWLLPDFNQADFVLRGPEVEAGKFFSIKYIFGY